MSFFKSEKISKSYEGKPVIEEITTEIQKGEIVSLLGVSGIGKTTLFNIMSGLEKPDSGKICLDGEDITGISGKVSYMQQKDLLLPFRNIMDNVSIPLRIQGMDKKKAREIAIAHLEEFGLEGTQNKYPAQLSGGMRQRAAFLRSYLYSKEVMLLDEPFSALDSLTKASMHKWYLEVAKAHNTTAFFITHDIDEALVLSDRIYIMTGVPGKIKSEIKIEYKEERNEDFKMSDTFIRYKKKIISSI